jgi:mono/diheme cytochrome c family protein
MSAEDTPVTPAYNLIVNRKLAPAAIAFLLPLLAFSGSVRDGVYTQQQADRGKALFGEECAKCHGETLGGGDGPELVGKEFVGRWKGNSVSGLFELIRKTMPTDDPGHLSTRQAADLTALILSANGYPAGDKDLPNTADALKDIKIEVK